MPSPRPRRAAPIQPVQSLSRTSRRRLALIAFACACLGVAAWLLVAQLTWRELPREGKTRRWQRGNYLHLDTNGDGIVDEEQYRFDRPNHAFVRRDLDFDGYFDLRYEMQSGVATHIEKIRERAPRH